MTNDERPADRVTSEPVEVMAYLHARAWAVTRRMLPQHEWEPHDDDEILLREVPDGLLVTIARASDRDDKFGVLWSGGTLAGFFERMLVR
ncbi:hypothetical protein [Microbispora siamensis]|uniref:hypothetical protein n=1 Tax=Microbispora siamensis TaxID=564413 RepID=UPI00194F08C5|nr:hypothetical protein [Microbispora siamensis]